MKSWVRPYPTLFRLTSRAHQTTSRASSIYTVVLTFNRLLSIWTPKYQLFPSPNLYLQIERSR